MVIAVCNVLSDQQVNVDSFYLIWKSKDSVKITNSLSKQVLDIWHQAKK